MEIPRFEKQNVNPRLVPTDIGDAFQGFVQELLQLEYPELHRFPGGGKDGGIDLIECSKTCFVAECKVIGEDDYAAVERRWKEVKKKLGEHTRDPAGPTPGQSQYGPWYPSPTPITEYVFCISSTLANEEQRRALKKEILEFFQELAQQRAHLSHLKALVVTILDWSDLSTRVRQRPHLLFRWYPGTRPNGLVPLDESIDVGTFRAYLTDAKLPYYSLADHLRTTPAPNGVSILDEVSLLQRFENPEITGLVISGKGGIGKSRLTLELGWLALRNGWSVMRVQSRLKEGALEDLAERLTPETQALLLVDYIETQSDFGELVENLNVLNDSGVARLRYIAACRTSYYHQAIAASGRHLPVDLTPPPGDASLDWFSDYRRYTVGNILAKAGLPVSQQHLTVCRDLPILAVFLAYLHTSGRSEDLAELLTEVEFGRWVAKRVQLTFPLKDVSRGLALLVPLFPMIDSAAERLSHDLYRPVFDRLATDGWIENVFATAPESFDTWVTAHDVLADQILLSYLRSVPNTAESFVAELLSLAADTDCLASAIVSLQRIADTPPLNAIDWLKVITSAITVNETHWAKIRDLLVRTTLLPVSDRIALLHNHEGLWADAERDITFQNSLGWFARWTEANENEGTPKLKEVLISWISKSLPFVQRNNFVITWGLKLAPEIVKEAALRWIMTRPLLFQTHYLMVAWLECRLPSEPISRHVHQWCQEFSDSFHLSFVVRAWLYADGDTSVVENVIKTWLTIYKTDPTARYVYKAWLTVGGEKELVRESIKDWLVVHQTDAEASFVFNAWLNAGGDKALVQDSIKEWLVNHQSDAEASRVFQAWLHAGGDKAVIQDAIDAWLVDHRSALESQFVYDAWLDAGGDKAVVQDAIKDWLVEHKTDAGASYVFKAWLDTDGDKELVKESIRAWLLEHREDEDADHVFRSWLEAGGERDLVWDSASVWLAKHRAEEFAVYVTKFIARQRNLPVNTVRDVLAWCHTFPKHEDALWRLTQLGSNLLVAGVEEDIIFTSEEVLADLLPPTSLPKSVTRGQVTTLFSYLIDSSQMQSGSLRERVDSLLVKWLKHPLSFGNDPKPHWRIQRISFLHRLSALIAAGVLDPQKDSEPLKRFMHWLNAWEVEWKQRAATILEELKHKYPVPELWDIVQFGE